MFVQYSFGQYYDGTYKEKLGKYLGVKYNGDSLVMCDYGILTSNHITNTVVWYGDGMQGGGGYKTYSWKNVGDRCSTIVLEGYEEGLYLSKEVSFTISNKRFDTISKIDTISIFDTIQTKVVDTVYKNLHDTIVVIKNTTTLLHDTVKIVDTITQHLLDTMYVIDTVFDAINTCRLGSFSKYNERLYNSKGESKSGNPITIESQSVNVASVEIETNESVDVEVFVYDNLGVSVTSGLYVLKASDEKQYINFNGYSKNGSKVSDGVYLIRVVSKHNNSISNNIYRVGIENKS